MFSSRYFLYNLIIFERNYLSCKYANDSKQHLIKRLNCENKMLFGPLLETSKQRRKKIEQEFNQNSKCKSDLELTTDLENVTPKLKGGQRRGRKSKKTDPKTLLSSEKDDVISGENIKQISKYVKSSSGCTSSKDFTTVYESVFKPSVPINTDNYPLLNEAKIHLSDAIPRTVLNYTASDSAMKYCISFPSVSKIIEETMSDENKTVLNKWKQNMINNLGQEGFKQYFKDLKSRGHDFHSAVCGRVLGKPTEAYSEVTQNALNSLEWILKDIKNPLAVESITAHPILEYKGIPDCVLHFRDVPVVVDWKLSDKPKKSLKDTYDAPLQVTAYIGALNHDPNFKWAIDHGLVAVAYTNGDPCDVFLLAPKHCQIYWRHWLKRIDKFKARNHFHTDHVIDEESL